MIEIEENRTEWGKKNNYYNIQAMFKQSVARILAFSISIVRAPVRVLVYYLQRQSHLFQLLFHY